MFSLIYFLIADIFFTAEVCDATNDAIYSSDDLIKILNLWKCIAIVILGSEILVRFLISKLVSACIPINLLACSERDVAHITNRCYVGSRLNGTMQVFHFS